MNGLEWAEGYISLSLSLSLPPPPSTLSLCESALLDLEPPEETKVASGGGVRTEIEEVCTCVY